LVEADPRGLGAPEFDRETVETVGIELVRSTTSIKRGVNESGHLNWFCWMMPTLTLLILLQLVLGATMRHQHAGLAIPDFPLAYGKIWPATDSASVELYNQKRMEATAVNPITAFQIVLQMVHRIVALLILIGVAFSAWQTRRRLGWKNPLSKMTVGWVILILAQAILGAVTIWSDKAADVATAHVLLGALSLASGTLISLLSWRMCTTTQRISVASSSGAVRTPRPTSAAAPA
jgi:heme A synthase